MTSTKSPAAEFSVDSNDLAAARQATHFILSIFQGPGRGYFRAPLHSLPLARQAGILLEHLEQSRGNPRLSMVFAITPTGRSVFVPRHLDALLDQPAQEASHDHNHDQRKTRAEAPAHEQRRDPHHPSRRWD